MRSNTKRPHKWASTECRRLEYALTGKSSDPIIGTFVQRDISETYDRVWNKKFKDDCAERRAKGWLVGYIREGSDKQCSDAIDLDAILAIIDPDLLGRDILIGVYSILDIIILFII